MGISWTKFDSWRKRYGKVNEHNSSIPRDHWLEEWEKQAIIRYHWEHPLEGYRRLAFMMLDADVVAVSPTSVYRVLKEADVIGARRAKSSLKGTGFDQPSRPHQHWHVDFAYINISGTFYFLCSLLDGYSRAIVHWEIRPKYGGGLTSRPSSSAPWRNTPRKGPGSFPTMGRSSSPGTSRSSFGCLE